MKIYPFYSYLNLLTCKLHLTTRRGIHKATLQMLTGFGVFCDCLKPDLALMYIREEQCHWMGSWWISNYFLYELGIFKGALSAMASSSTI